MRSANELNALIIVHPDKFYSVVQDAMKAAGSITKAAKLLNVSRRTLFRWLRRDPDLGAAGVTSAN